MNKTSIKFFLIDVGLVFITIGSFFLLYLGLFDGTTVNKPLNLPEVTIVQTDKTEYRRGETVVAHFSFCKNRALNPLIAWQLVDGYVISFEGEYGILPRGCYDLEAPIKEIPKTAQLNDEYHFVGKIIFEVNPIRKVEYTIRTNEFTVIP